MHKITQCIPNSPFGRGEGLGKGEAEGRERIGSKEKGVPVRKKRGRTKWG